jgi:saccharopine dehydrogenase-like NADP-dependent oxidoreductase
MQMTKVLVLGAGKIGSLISWLLVQSGDYEVHVADANSEALARFSCELSHSRLQACTLDVLQRSCLADFLKQNGIEAVVSALPYFCNKGVAEAAGQQEAHYLDLTEDIDVAATVRQISAGASRAFAPQCGLAPGFISIVANDIMSRFSELNAVKLRVGALPINPSNALKYALTWSTNGLINEYINPCHAIHNGAPSMVQALEGYETIQLDGLLYEAFNTSGGLGTLADTYVGRVVDMNYKTLRYPGHCDRMRFLIKDLQLWRDREMLARILEHAVPTTHQDVVLIYVSVTGRREGEFLEETFVKKLYPKEIGGLPWTAIQVSTASAACAMLDMVLHGGAPARGFVTQESVSLAAFLANRFGRYYS